MLKDRCGGHFTLHEDSAQELQNVVKVFFPPVLLYLELVDVVSLFKKLDDRCRARIMITAVFPFYTYIVAHNTKRYSD